MPFGSTLGKACLTFVITNIDDAFVLVTFFAEAATSRNLTPLKITLGQYIGFTVIVAISLIGYAVAVVLPSEPIGFLGLLPTLLGVWRFFALLFPPQDDTDDEQSESARIANARSVFKVASITVMNGGDNMGTYIPLFSQAKGAEMPIYVVVYYILLGVWVLVAFVVMKQKHILRLVERYASLIVPFLYIGLGIYIVVQSDCYPWSVQEINNQFLGNPGQTVMSVTTTFLLSSIMGIMVWARMRKQDRPSTGNGDMELSEGTAVVAKSDDNGGQRTSKNGDFVDHKSSKPLEHDTEMAGSTSAKAEVTEEISSLDKSQLTAAGGNHEIRPATSSA